MNARERAKMWVGSPHGFQKPIVATSIITDLLTELDEIDRRVASLITADKIIIQPPAMTESELVLILRGEIQRLSSECRRLERCYHEVKSDTLATNYYIEKLESWLSDLQKELEIDTDEGTPL